MSFYLKAQHLISDCGVGSLVKNGTKTIVESVSVESGMLEQKLLYSCNDGFVLYPNITVKNCITPLAWSPVDEISCLHGKIY